MSEAAAQDTDPFARIEALLADAERLVDPQARRLVRALATALVDTTTAALRKAIELGGENLARALADDPLTGSLLVLAGAHPDAPTVRVARALAEAKAQLDARSVTVVRVEEAPRGVRVVLAGERGTPIDRARLFTLVEQLALGRAPDTDNLAIELDGQLVLPAGFVPAERLRVLP